MASHVFISYASPDQAVALDVCARLEAEGVPCWIAPRDVRPGVPYARSILDGIDHAGMMVLIFSAHANASHHVPREVERAANHGLAILPLRIEAVKPAGELEYFVSALHWLDALDGQWARHVPHLVGSIKDIVEPGKPRDGGGAAPPDGAPVLRPMTTPVPLTTPPPPPPPPAAGARAGAAAAAAVGSVVNWVKGIPNLVRPDASRAARLPRVLPPPPPPSRPPPPPPSRTPPDPAAAEARQAAARQVEMARAEAERRRREADWQQQEHARLAEAGRRAQQQAANDRAAEIRRRRAENRPRLRELHEALRDFVDRKAWAAARPFVAEILRIDPTDPDALSASAQIEAGLRGVRPTPPPVPPRMR